MCVMDENIFTKHFLFDYLCLNNSFKQEKFLFDGKSYIMVIKTSKLSSLRNSVLKKSCS